MNVGREFVRLPQFEKQCKHLNIDEYDIMEIENILLGNPSAGTIMKGTGGVRKFRIPLNNKGKRGGARVIYLDFVYYEKVYLIAVFSKGEIENLTKAERNELKKLVAILEVENRKKEK